MVNVIIMTLKVFVSSNIEEFKEERKLLHQEHIL